MTPEKWKRVNALFGGALELEPHERAAFVNRECGGDAILRELLESVLASYDDLEKELESEQGERKPLSAGQRLGRYRIEREIDRGGMGIVYLAEDTRLGRQVALKVLPPEMMHDPRQRARLEGEAKAAAQLHHAGLATVHELDDFDGVLYIVSEYVSGRNLRDELERGVLSLEPLLETCRDIADALAHAHAHGVVHRDLKPENVIRTEDGRVKIVDFGLALVDGPAHGMPPGRRWTRADLTPGTPAYMAPEQIRGGTVDFQADVFSFGILLYELASGMHPFEGPDTPSTLVRILHFEPCPLPPLCGVPPELDRIVQRCLQKNPEHRYLSTHDLVVDLDRLCRRIIAPGTMQSAAEGSTTRAKPELARGDARWWWRFHQVAVTIFYVIAALGAWTIRDVTEDLFGEALFYAAVPCAVLPGALRLHFLFLDRVDPAALGTQMRQTGPRVRLCDWALTVLLLLMAVRVMMLNTAIAGAIVAVAVGFGVSVFAVEPITRRAAFGRPTGIRRRRMFGS